MSSIEEGRAPVSRLAPLEDDDKPRYFLTKQELRVLAVASTGFFVDAYDLFIINMIVPILAVVYTGKLSSSITGIPLDGGLLKAGTNIGCVIGQIAFGFMGDYFGRGKVYGKELAVTILGTILFISCPSPGTMSKEAVFGYLTGFRVLMGIGIGGDYPNSSGTVSDRANIKRRGIMLAFIFSFQGWGSFIGSILAIVLLEIYKTSVHEHGHVSHLNSLWRLLAGLIIAPAFITMIYRFRLGSSVREKNVQAIRADPTLIEKEKDFYLAKADKNSTDEKLAIADDIPSSSIGVPATADSWETLRYFSEWRHLKLLLGTAGSWFLVDITFYGINLNQSIVIQSVGLANSKEPWTYLFDLAKANLIIAAAGFLPGYYLTMLLIERLGRKNIQLIGFTMNALFLGILAGDFVSLKTKPAAFIVCFAFLQLFFNFGANATTFIVPAEIFPTRVRGGAHGFSAACGKCGAILSALGFSVWQKKIGTPNVLWIFFAISFLGIGTTLLIEDTTGRDADAIDLKERQEAAGIRSVSDQ